MTVFAFIKRTLARLDFKYQRQQKEWRRHLNRRDAEWQNNTQQGIIAITKARRLAEIARERNALKDELAKVIKAKKARAPIYAALRALSIEELRVETGK
jgi:hypothetical protein